MEFQTTVMCPYLRPGPKKDKAKFDNIILASNTGHLMVGECTTLTISAA